MAISLKQASRPLTAATPLGDDTLVAVGLSGVEAVSRLFQFTVDFVSTRATVSPAGLLGKPMTLNLPLLDGGSRPIHGLVRKFSSVGRAGELYRYRAEVVPALWFLSLSSDCRTFEQMSPLDVVEEVCRKAGVSDFKRRVTTAPPKLEYVVQYRETNLDFVSRLLEEAGMYYCFEHTHDKHDLVFSDAHAGGIPAGAMAEVVVDPALANGRPRQNVVFRLERDYAVHSASVAIADHDLLRPDSTGSASSTSPGAKGERFDFIGDLGPNTSAATAKQLIEADESGRDVVRGSSTCATLVPGTRVTLSEAVPGSTGSAADVHVLRVTHRLEAGDVLAGGSLVAEYENQFEAIPAATVYRPDTMTPKPSVRGTQTAIIVGSGGTGEIDVDADGRVLLQFPWDRGAGKDGASKHRVHVATLWAGTGWGTVQLPRVGQQVLVEYLEADPDRPIVTGRVFDGTHKPPYALPANKTQSGIKSRTLGGADENFNEMRFEDKKGSEQIFVQAEKDLMVTVKHDETRSVQNDRATTIKHADTRTVQEGDDTHTVSKGNQTVEVIEGNQSITVKGGNQTIEVSKGDQSVTVAQGKQTVTVQGDQSVTIHQGNRSVTVQQGNDTLAIKTGNLSIQLDVGNVSMNAKAGKVTIESLQGIDLKVGPSSIQVAPSGITVKGPMLTLEAQGPAELKGAMVTVEGQAMTQVKAPMTQVNGDGMLMLKGGITMIN
ncbi:MAG TPA: type VI secretion system tip protein TssI/VgrG [Gemmatimonadaceae bacterium]|nr:type VI secretion system tip protein TssI/VgrG [Gemmatimonadaceae bacterium]